jgi:hypothetical protein
MQDASATRAGFRPIRLASFCASRAYHDALLLEDMVLPALISRPARPLRGTTARVPNVRSTRLTVTSAAGTHRASWLCAKGITVCHRADPATDP